MIDYQTYCAIREGRERDGLTGRQIARKLGLRPETVSKWLKRPRYEQRKAPPRASKLDAHKGKIARLLEAHPYTAVQVLTRLREDGYEGSYTILKRLIQTVRPRPAPAFLTLQFAPGQCAQLDWGSWGSVQVGNTRRKLSFFALVLAWSRMLYVEFTLRQSQELFLSCHERAFQYLGGVPQEIWIDYVPGNIIDLLCPTRLCGKGTQAPMAPVCPTDGGVPVTAHNFRSVRSGSNRGSAPELRLYDRTILQKTRNLGSPQSLLALPAHRAVRRLAH
jgi:transcriptional regulator with XRE-family HTH domain